MNLWVSHYGYVLVALFLFVEAAGVPVPGETALVTAAALAGRGTISLIGVVIAGVAGTIAGGHAGYWLGAHGGHDRIIRHGKWIGLTEKRLAHTQQFFTQHGAKTVLLGRFVAVVRSFIGILAGLAGMPARKFATFNAAGGAVWVAAFSALGFVFGRNLPRLVHYIGRVSLVVALLIAIVAAVVFLARWFARNRTLVAASLDQRLERVSAMPRVSRVRLQHPRVWQLLWGRYGHGEYLAVHLGIGFVISLAVIGIFASITEGLVESSPLTRFDIAIANRLQQSASTGMLETFSAVSNLGGHGAMTVLLVAGGMLYAFRRRGLELAGWVAAFIGASLLDASLRFVVRRSELPFADVVLIDWGTGLTSGHALGVLVGYGMLAYLLMSFARGAAVRTLIIVFATTMVVGITIGRLFLGQHYFSDATAGLAAGFVWLAVCVSGIELARQRQTN